MESSIFLSDPFYGVFWNFKVERRVLTSGTVFSLPLIERTKLTKKFDSEKNCHFCILLARLTTIQVLHQKFEKVPKTTQNVPKTVDNH